jgi:hypothetical protein
VLDVVPVADVVDEVVEVDEVLVEVEEVEDVPVDAIDADVEVVEDADVDEEVGAGASDGVVDGVGDTDFDGVGDGDTDFDGVGDGDLDGVGEGDGGRVRAVDGAGTSPTTRAAPKNSDHHTGEIFTTSPVVGAWTIRPLPMYIPTWWIEVQSLRSVPKNSRSPGSSLLIGTWGRAWYWSLETRGRFTPTEWYAYHIRPEQSKVFGPSVPQT